MKDLKTKGTVLIAYHANCIDGFTSAWVTFNAMHKKGYRCDTLPMKYNDHSLNIFSEVIGSYSYAEIYIVDYSLPIEVLQSLQNYRKDLKITILDHHKTAFERYFPEVEVTSTTAKQGMIEGATIILDNNQCGASLCWDHFHPELIAPKLIKYVRDYDLWRFEYGMETKFVNKYLRTLDQGFPTWDHVANELEYPHGLMYILDTGKKLQLEHDQEVAKIVAQADLRILQGIKGLSAECPYRYASDVGNELAKKCGTFGATYYIDHEAGKIKWSLRSNNKSNIDVSAVAKAFGGGGHRNAAGFEVEFASEVIDTGVGPEVGVKNYG